MVDNTSENKELACAYMLHNVSGIGNKTLFSLLDYFGSCNDIYDAKESDFKSLLTKKQLESFLSLRDSFDLQRELDQLSHERITFYPYTLSSYPEKLKLIPDPPFGIYCIGSLPDPKKPAVSIIGARTSSEYGKYAAKLFGEGLADHGVAVISGMARGIDGISQAAALNAGGVSYGVLGSGVDVCYPKENIQLYNALKTRGGVISEYLPGTQPKPNFFPPRNRIISGLSDVVLVIEARQKSGTLITVDMALEQGRDVFALPGRICDNLSYGCNSLIHQGAAIATCPEDIVEFLRRTVSPDIKNSGDKKKLSTFIELSDAQKAVYDALDVYPKSINVLHDELTEKGIHMDASDLMNALVELSILKYASQNGGSFYKTL